VNPDYKSMAAEVIKASRASASQIQIVVMSNNSSEITPATVSYVAMEGFANAKVLADALRRAGSKLTRAGFVKALESMQRVDFGGRAVNYSANDHTGSEFVELTVIGKNGCFVR
jgi:branched-chain amino acid transport system substrate-binding protein